MSDGPRVNAWRQRWKAAAIRIARRVQKGELAPDIDNLMAKHMPSQSQAAREKLIAELTARGVELSNGLSARSGRAGAQRRSESAALAPYAKAETSKVLDRSADEASDDFDPASISDAQEAVARYIQARRGQKVFRDQLLKAYRKKCAITGCSVADVLEAAHIVPYMGQDTNHVSNGILLRADLHTLFDCGLICIEPNTLRVLVASGVQEGPYAKIHNKKIRARQLGVASVNRTALKIRYEIFVLNHNGT